MCGSIQIQKHVGWTECPCVDHTKHKVNNEGKVTINVYNNSRL